MRLTQQTPRQFLNPLLSQKSVVQSSYTIFSLALEKLVQTAQDESEEHQKNCIRDFLKASYGYDANATGKIDDAIFQNGSVAVIIEAKRLGNKNEMPSSTDLNKKALHETILYFMQERAHGNEALKHIIITNLQEWFIFDAQEYNRLFWRDKTFHKLYTDWASGGVIDTRNPVFYDKVKHFCAAAEFEIGFAHFNLANPASMAEKDLIAIYKLLSPDCLLKAFNPNDANSLNREFYNELLYILGLQEVKEGGKKLIQAAGTAGSLYDSIADKLDQYSKPHGFEDVIKLIIIWINRILFLKLLESQIVTWTGDKNSRFLSTDKISSYDALESLFFDTLARRVPERKNKGFDYIPYLNSSLFERQADEDKGIGISNLSDSAQIEYYGKTVVKDAKTQRKSGQVNTLAYLFEFLDAYDFSNDSGDEVVLETKTLISASVLGLIFEKINGYKDGSYYTPSFVTMYMARQTIEKAVLQKFNEKYGWECKTLIELHNKNDDIAAANALIDSLKICDPAVGSGHFLVSSLNEVLRIKAELGVLVDAAGKRIKDWHLSIENDELLVTSNEGELFEYKRGDSAKTRLQKTLFQEKQKIIENCLFGVDINPNSVNICRLRLWIELLKNAYYQDDGTLETLPNIDINIKCGNSLISRFALDADLGKALKKSNWDIESYRAAVSGYRNASNKDEKRQLLDLITRIKTDFRTEISANDPKVLRLNALRDEQLTLTMQTHMFELSKKEQTEWDKNVAAKQAEIAKAEAEIKAIRNNAIYRNAFEWRFEFPEVLDDAGAFIGFDVLIGNPPYIRQESFTDWKGYLLNRYMQTGASAADLYVYFVELAMGLLRTNGDFSYIIPNKWMRAGYGDKMRQFVSQHQLRTIIDFGGLPVFDEATTYPSVMHLTKTAPIKEFKACNVRALNFPNGLDTYFQNNCITIELASLSAEAWTLSDKAEQQLLNKIKSQSVPLGDYVNGGTYRGILTGLNEAFVIDRATKEELIAQDAKSAELIKPFLAGRDIKRYHTPKADKFLILFPKGFTIKRNIPQLHAAHSVAEPPPRYGDMPYDAAWEWVRQTYPAIARHLLPFKTKAEMRSDKGDYWWELRACDYYGELENPKIMYQVFQVKPCFIYDESGLICNNSIWSIPTTDKVLLGVLNSKLGWWLISKYCTGIQNGYQLIWRYLAQLPIAQGKPRIRSEIVNLINTIMDASPSDALTQRLNIETQIDDMVYKLYDLTYDEVLTIDPEYSSMSREAYAAYTVEESSV